jgi:gamma-glutamyltranspeptidase/glutathione hydrolase
MVMRRGGSAADAAVAAGAVLTVVEPWASHIGGDAFAILWDAASGRARAIQGSGAAPRACDPALFRDGIPMRGALPITVPGLVGAWFHLHGILGKLPIADVLAPAIALATEGFPVGERWERAGRLHRDLIRRDPGLAALFLRGEEAVRAERPNHAENPVGGGEPIHTGEPIRAGDWVCQKDLAATLTGLARHGAAYLYAGDLGARIAGDLRNRGGILSTEDLRAHETEERDPLSIELTAFSAAPGTSDNYPSQSCTVLEQPPVSQGGMVLDILGWLEAADREGGRGGGASPRGESREDAREMHMQILAYREARERRDRAFSDPRFAGRDTTYLCTVDPSGNAVSWIQSIFQPFGAGFIVPGTGIILNDRMTGFSLDPASPNRLEPGKRTIHTLNTWMALREGRPWILGGTPGGERQVQTNVQVLRSRLAHGRPLAEALEAPRWGIDDKGRVEVEARLPRDTRRRLEALGHKVVRVGPWNGSGFVQAIERLDGGGWLACTDPRGEGLAAGF